MRTGRAVWMNLGALGLAATVALADLESNPYQTIYQKNPFRLKEPPPPPSNEPPPPPPPPQPTVKLTGIVTLFGKKKVFLEVTEPGAKSTDKLTLMEGERLGKVEVVTIDPDKSQVAVRIDGTETNITFEKVETAKAGAPPPGTPQPPSPAMFRPPGFPAMPGAVPGATPGAGLTVPKPGTPGTPSSGSSVMVFGAGSSGSGGSGSSVMTFGASTPAAPTVPAAPAVPATPGATYSRPGTTPSVPVGTPAGIRSIPTIPSRTIRTDTPNPGGAAVGRPMSKEEADLNMELLGRVPGLPPAPPTSLTHLSDPNDERLKHMPESVRQRILSRQTQITAPPAPPGLPGVPAPPAPQ